MGTAANISKATSRAPRKRIPANRPVRSAFSTPPEETKKEKHIAHLLHKLKPRFVNMSLIKLSLLVLAVLFLGASGVAVYAYNLYQESQAQIKTLQNTKETAKAETQQLTDAVARLMVLPKDETPTIATVTDSKKLQTQAFFSKASNGDKVLIYSKAKKAILYNPTQNIVVEVAPVNLGKNAKPEVAGTAVKAPTAAPTVAFQPPAATVPPQLTTQP